ncbi:MAG: ribosome-associated translation inhibitor RaiA [Dehalococcoidia bacterium]|nr:ribosome-associated translation inhibitor RaiA [Dehalococcoidia bacterium]MDD5495002.1 ribosome-associated translation inhibitor RaiA [Dehalococcoidia bacterium]
MQVQVVTKNLSIADDIKVYAEEKISRLSRYLNNITSAKIELAAEKSKSRQHLYTAQVTLNVNGFIIRGEHKAESIRGSVDTVAEVMERLVTKYKKKYEISKGRTAESIKQASNVKPSAEDEYPKEKELVKSKRFIVKPMSTSEAVDQMEFLGHDFFLFLNIDDNTVNVVYRRKDGRYGLIQPEVS